MDTDWDLGVGDSTAIWFSQSLRSGEVRLIDPTRTVARAPHDIRVRELGTGKSRLETAKNDGINFQIVRDIGVPDGIDAARLLLPRCWFDEEKCKVGMEALTFYRKNDNERLLEFTDKPLHDWWSHGRMRFAGWRCGTSRRIGNGRHAVNVLRVAVARGRGAVAASGMHALTPMLRNL